MRLVSDLGQNQQIIPAKGIRGLPFSFIFKKPGKRDVVSEVVADRVFPDGRFDQAQAQLMNRFFSWCVRHRRGWRRYSIDLVCIHLYSNVVKKISLSTKPVAILPSMNQAISAMPKDPYPMSLRLPPELHQRLEECAARLKIKRHTLAQYALEAAIEAIERNGYRLSLPMQFRFPNESETEPARY